MSTSEKRNNAGKVFSDETRQKMRDARVGKYLGANSPRAKGILQIDTSNNKILGIYPTAKQASDELGINQGSLSMAAQGKIPSAGGYYWLFTKDNEGVNEIGKVIKTPLRPVIGEVLPEVPYVLPVPE